MSDYLAPKQIVNHSQSFGQEEGCAGFPDIIGLPAALRGIPFSIWTLDLVSMLIGILSEMIHAMLLGYRVTALGTSTVSVGIIEGRHRSHGVYREVFSGALSDRLGRRTNWPRLVTVL